MGVPPSGKKIWPIAPPPPPPFDTCPLFWTRVVPLPTEICPKKLGGKKNKNKKNKNKNKNKKKNIVLQSILTTTFRLNYAKKLYFVLKTPKMGHFFEVGGSFGLSGNFPQVPPPPIHHHPWSGPIGTKNVSHLPSKFYTKKSLKLNDVHWNDTYIKFPKNYSRFTLTTTSKTHHTPFKHIRVACLFYIITTTKIIYRFTLSPRKKNKNCFVITNIYLLQLCFSAGTILKSYTVSNLLPQY